MHIEQLQHFALGDHGGGARHDFHDGHAVNVDHHLKSPRIQVIADQHACRITKHGVGCASAASQVGFVDDVVVQ